MISELWLWYIERILYGEGFVCEYRSVQQRENESTSSRGFQAASIVPSFSCYRRGTRGTSTRRHVGNASNSGWFAAKRNMCVTVRSSRRCVAASHMGNMWRRTCSSNCSGRVAPCVFIGAWRAIATQPLVATRKKPVSGRNRCSDSGKEWMTSLARSWPQQQ